MWPLLDDKKPPLSPESSSGTLRHRKLMSSAALDSVWKRVYTCKSEACRLENVYQAQKMCSDQENITDLTGSEREWGVPFEQVRICWGVKMEQLLLQLCSISYTMLLPGHHKGMLLPHTYTCKRMHWLDLTLKHTYQWPSRAARRQ